MSEIKFIRWKKASLIHAAGKNTNDEQKFVFVVCRRKANEQRIANKLHFSVHENEYLTKEKEDI
jgi:hypothetical protein